MSNNLRINPSMNKVHANKFKLIIPKISIIEDIFELYALNFIELNIKGTIASGLTVAAQSVPGIAHKPFKLTGAGYDMQEIKVSFLIDGDFLNYYMMWSWLNKIYNLKTAVAPSLDKGQNPYENFQIIGMDNYNKEVVKFNYAGGFITSISEVEVAYDNPERLEASVTFAYDDYVVELPNFSTN